MEYTITKCNHGYLVRPAYDSSRMGVLNEMWAYTTLDQALKAFPKLFEPKKKETK